MGQREAFIVPYTSVLLKNYITTKMYLGIIPAL